MAKVTRFIEADEKGISTEEWHAVVSYPHPRTVCGLQLEGEDGERHLPAVEGRVTCGTCMREIEQIKSIRNWKPRPTPLAVDLGWVCECEAVNWQMLQDCGICGKPRPSH